MAPQNHILEREAEKDSEGLRAFTRGVAILSGGRLRRLTLGPAGGVTAVQALGLRGALSVASLTARDLVTPADRIRRAPDDSIAAYLAASHVDTRSVDTLLRPFLSGVLGEDQLATSSRYFRLLWRCFIRGGAAIPSDGMAALPQQIAASLLPDSVSLNSPVTAVAPGQVTLADGRSVVARAVVVAVDALAAHRLLASVPAPRCNGLTTFYHTAPESPAEEPLLRLDADQPHLIRNTVVLTAASPAYGSGGRPLIATTVLGVQDRSREAAVRERLAHLYRTDTSRWQLVASYAIAHALPSMAAPHRLRRRVRLDDGLYVCGDHRDTSSIQGAIVSGRRAARAVVEDLNPTRTTDGA
jgi:hypothetical protein